MGASAAGMVCYTGTDASGPYRLTQTTVGCLLVNVPRCVWYVQDEDSLIQIAARFSTNWLQVWHFNPMLLHPDDSLIPQSLLNIGHLYQVSPYAVLALLFAYAAMVLTKTGFGEGGGGVGGGGGRAGGAQRRAGGARRPLRHDHHAHPDEQLGPDQRVGVGPAGRYGDLHHPQLVPDRRQCSARLSWPCALACAPLSRPKTAGRPTTASLGKLGRLRRRGGLQQFVTGRRG